MSGPSHDDRESCHCMFALSIPVLHFRIDSLIDLENVKYNEIYPLQLTLFIDENDQQKELALLERNSVVCSK